MADTRHAMTADACPRLHPHARLRFDGRRERWVLLLPERVFIPDEIAVEILHLCDGTSSVDDIVAELANRYAAEHAIIDHDVRNLLAGLRQQGVIQG